MEPQQMTVPFDRLMHDAGANVRKKYSDDDMIEMKASILADGLIQPIAVRPPVTGDADLGGQLYRIFAGGRRFRAISELIAEKNLPADYSVPIIVRDVDDATATAMSLAENMIREQMTPVDEFRAFNSLVEAGQSVEDIALRFGQSDRYVKGRLALARLHPDILAAFGEGKISYGAACAYTLNPDQGVQYAFYKDGGWSRDQTWSIKAAMKQAAISASSPIAEFIGEEFYKAAGGIVHEDLFGEDSYWISVDLLPGLKAEAVERSRSEVLSEGWSFFATTEELGIGGIYDVRAISPEGMELSEEETARMDEISDELEGADADDADAEETERLQKLSAEYEELEARANAFSTEQKAKTGIVIDLESMQIRRGCLKPGVKSKEDACDDEPLAAAAKSAKDPLALTQPLKDKIGETASEALAAAVLRDPYRALALATAMLAAADDHTMGVGRPSRLKVERVDYASGRDAKSTDIKKLFDTFAKLHPDELLKRFAGFMSQTVDLTERWFYKDGYTSDDRKEKTRLDFMTVFGADPLEEFDAEAWFAACTKPMIEAAANDMGFALSGAKKADMAKVAAAEATARGWLPKELRLKGYALKKDGSADKPTPKRRKKKEA